MLTNPSEDCAVVTGCVGLGKHLGPGNLPGRLGALYVTHADQQMHRGSGCPCVCSLSSVSQVFLFLFLSHLSGTISALFFSF